MVGTIWQAKKECCKGFPGRVMARSNDAGCGTPRQHSGIATQSLYRPEYAKHAQASIRTTAAAIGVSPTTVHRWANRYYFEFGSRIELERGYMLLVRLEASIEAVDNDIRGRNDRRPKRSAS
jgi:hypothetical protein